MENAIILHGTDCHPDSFWQPSIAEFLKQAGYDVWVPQLPQAVNPDLTKWLPFVLSKGKFNKNTILIGHSAGGPLVLSILEQINVQIHKAILVAAYARPKGEKKAAELILQKKYNWQKIKAHASDLIFINSDKDPWGCDYNEGLYMWKHAGGTLILREGEGHMGSYTYKRPYTKFPLLEKLLEVRYSRNSIDGSDKK